MPNEVPLACRAKESCDPAQVVVHAEKEVTFSLELPPVKTAERAAAIAVEYAQRAAFVRISGMIENKDCAASDGEYKLAVSVRDENRELKTLELVESWQRQDDP